MDLMPGKYGDTYPLYHPSTDQVEDDAVKADRLEKLAQFQLQMIRHAMKCKIIRSNHTHPVVHVSKSTHTPTINKHDFP